MNLADALTDAVTEAVTRVFSTMATVQTTRREVTDLSQTAHDSLEGVTGSVSFVGQVTGTLYLSLPSNFCRLVTQQILGGDGLTDREENDVVGELTNMVTGNLKTAMANKGYNSQLSIPSVLRGESITLSCKGFSCVVGLTFDAPDLKESFHVRVMGKID
jgi:CheY-specific phosphatase CheX